MYLYYTNAASRIHTTIPDCKLIAVLRNPVDRAFSAYVHAVRDGLEPLTFEAAIDSERQRMNSGQFTPLQAYVECGLYSQKLAPFMELFDRNQILLIAYDEIKQDLSGVLKKACRFLDVGEDFEFNIKPKLNRSGVPRRKWLHRLTQNAARDKFPFQYLKKPFTNDGWVRLVKGIEFWNYEKLKLTPDQRRWLMPRFVEDINRLSSETGIDFLSMWTDPPMALTEGQTA